ncbi:2-hydroxyacid dehydrogenase [Saccharomonospora glauca]|uniref:Phosphoglycerate dehydrogenase-like oxidoreductase n=1 Tax=Saccharomonospora glauca K62 TaxID=928724 RepID=I1D665_9PSEU|nr:2-hydroxyacid dehydrogenase [Saccharomonospora glauca]EIF00440.1 phosphoglycerate dehydrogenase-like oxidoreductase [Saccharomonospora glauca K62]
MRILSAGDEFVGTDLLQAAVRAELAGTGVDPEFRELSLPWPIEPFGPVAEVNEASGTEEQVIEALDGAEVAVTQMAPFTGKVFEAAPNLKLVSVCRGGPVNVDLAAATEAGVAVTFAPGRNAAAAAEFAVGLLLAAMRRISTSSAELLAGTWRGDYYAYPNAGVELEGTTVGLVGYGAIGARVAKVLLAFGAKVLVADPYADRAAVEAAGAELVELDELMRRSFAVSLHARLTEETRNLIDAEKLALLPHGAVLVNSARGGLLDYSPLPEMLRSGRLGAVALDVYDVEPPPADWALRDAPNVIATPHLAGASKQTADRAAAIVAAEVGRYVRGEALANVANPDVLTR